MWQIGRCVRPLLGRRAEVRGGSWNNNRDNARVANRNRNNAGNSNNNNGFRIVLSPLSDR